MGISQELYVKAKTIIPGGTQLLSKRPEIFLPNQWPAYYSKCKGCEVWDLDNNHFYDFAQMGVGSCTLGYANDDIDEAVVNAIKNGSMCTLNAPEEVELAEKLIELHPWGEMVRYARTGGEACSIAIRIARAATGKSIVAFCGYHGWSDWYISANIGDTTKLDEQLLPGLKPAGVPRELKGTALPFKYNDLQSLKDLIAKNRGKIAAIIMEPQRGTPPTQEFLQGIREIALKESIVLIFDEVTSGFRINYGGIHLTMGVNPDIAVFGKALGNGYAISAILGRRNIMDAAQNSFISSTFWTERIGYVAAITTLKKMEEIKVQDMLIKIGKQIKDIWLKAAEESGINIHTSGIDPLLHIGFNYDNANAIQTLYAQEMLKRGYLVGAAVYATIAYTDEVLKGFADATYESFGIIANAIKQNSIEQKLLGPVKHSGFTRLVY